MPQTTLTRKQSVAIAAAMTALSHPRRVIIFDRLAAAPKEGLTYEALLAATGLNTSTLTHHLRPMFAAGLVVTRRKGRYVFHRLKPSALSPAIVDLRRIAA